MNTNKLFAMSALMLAITLALVGAVSAIPVDITRVEIDDHKVDPNEVNKLDITRDNTVEFEIFLESTQDVDDVEIQVFVSGFDHNQDLRLSDYVGPFDMDEGNTYRKTLSINFPDLVQEDDYRVRVIVTDRNGDELIQNYNVKIDVDRHKLRIVDAIFTPSRTVQAGQALLGVVRVENFGEKDEDDVKVTISVPALDMQATDYINEIESDEEEETEELFLRLPRCAEPGMYDLNIKVQYNDGFDQNTAKTQIEVLENPACAPEVVEVITSEPTSEVTEAVPRTSKVRAALEVILLVLVALLVVIGLIIGFTKMGNDE